VLGKPLPFLEWLKAVAVQKQAAPPVAAAVVSGEGPAKRPRLSDSGKAASSSAAGGVQGDIPWQQCWDEAVITRGQGSSYVARVLVWQQQLLSVARHQAAACTAIFEIIFLPLYRPTCLPLLQTPAALPWEALGSGLEPSSSAVTQPAAASARGYNDEANPSDLQVMMTVACQARSSWHTSMICGSHGSVWCAAPNAAHHSADQPLLHIHRGLYTCSIQYASNVCL